MCVYIYIYIYIYIYMCGSPRAPFSCQETVRAVESNVCILHDNTIIMYTISIYIYIYIYICYTIILLTCNYYISR